MLITNKMNINDSQKGVLMETDGEVNPYEKKANLISNFSSYIFDSPEKQINLSKLFL